MQFFHLEYEFSFEYAKINTHIIILLFSPNFIKKQSLIALNNMITIDVSNQDRIRRKHGIPVLLRMLRGSNEEVQNETIKLLLSLLVSKSDREFVPWAVNERNRAVIHNAIPIVANFLHHANRDIQESAVYLLAGIGIKNDKYQELLYETDAIVILLRWLNHSVAKIRKAACFALPLLIDCESDIISEAMSIPDLIELLSQKKSYSDTTVAVAKIMSKLSFNKERCEMICRLGGVRALYFAMNSKRFSSEAEDDVKSALLEFFINSDQALTIIVDLGGKKAIEKILQSASLTQAKIIRVKSQPIIENYLRKADEKADDSSDDEMNFAKQYRQRITNKKDSSSKKILAALTEVQRPIRSSLKFKRSSIQSGFSSKLYASKSQKIVPQNTIRASSSISVFPTNSVNEKKNDRESKQKIDLKQDIVAKNFVDKSNFPQLYLDTESIMPFHCEATCLGSDSVQAFVVLSDGRLASAHHHSRSIHIWNTESGECLATPKEKHNHNIASLAVLPDGKLVSGCETWLCVWDTNRMRCVDVIGADYLPRNMTVLLDGQLITVCDSTFLIFDMEKRTRIYDAGFSTMKAGSIRKIAVLTNGQLVTVDDRGFVGIWDIQRKECISFLNEDASALAALPDGGFAIGKNDGSIRCSDNSFYNNRNYRHTGRVTALVALSDELLASGGVDKTVRIWNLRSNECMAVFTEHTAEITSLVVLPDGRLVSGAGGADKKICLWYVGLRPVLADTRQKLTKVSADSKCLTIEEGNHKIFQCFSPIHDPDKKIMHGLYLEETVDRYYSWTMCLKLYENNLEKKSRHFSVYKSIYYEPADFFVRIKAIWNSSFELQASYKNTEAFVEAYIDKYNEKTKRQDEAEKEAREKAQIKEMHEEMDREREQRKIEEEEEERARVEREKQKAYDRLYYKRAIIDAQERYRTFGSNVQEGDYENTVGKAYLDLEEFDNPRSDCTIM